MNKVLTHSTHILFNIAEPSPEDVYTDDIVKGLIAITRLLGRGWSVARHTLLTTDIYLKIAYDKEYAVSPQEKLHVLLHDAHEAYIGDIPTPVKAVVGSDVKEVSDKIDNAIFSAYGIPHKFSQEHDEMLALADAVALFVEAEIKLGKELVDKLGIGKLPAELLSWSRTKEYTKYQDLSEKHIQTELALAIYETYEKTIRRKDNVEKSS